MLGVLFVSLQASGKEVLIDNCYYEIGDDGAVFKKAGNNLMKYKGTFVFPDSIVYEDKEYPVIGIVRFTNAVGMDSIVLPKTLKFIEDCAFYRTAVRTLVLPEGFERLGNNVFSLTTCFHKIYIPSTIKEVGTIFALYNCKDNRGEIHVADLDAWCRAKCGCVSAGAQWDFYVGEGKISEVDIPEGITEMDKQFSYCRSITSVKIPASVQSISDSAFMYASNINTFTFAENSSLKTVGVRGFCYCRNIINLSLPEGLTEIKDYAFQDCLCERLILPSTLKKVGKDVWGDVKAIQVPDLQFWLNLDLIYTEDHNRSKHRLFVGEEELKKLTVPEDATVKNNAFRHISSLEEVVFPAGCKTDIGDYAFSHCASLNTVSILCDMKRIGEYAFAYNYIKNLSIMGKIDTVCKEAFYDIYFSDDHNVYTSDITNWLKIHFERSPYRPSNPLYVGAHFFVGDEEVKDLVIPEGTDSVYNDAFFGACFINSISLPESLKYIGIGAFYGCFEGEEYIEGRKPKPISGGDDPENPTNGILYVPAGTKAYYEGTGDWNGVTIIEREATSAKTALTTDGAKPVSFYDLMGNRSQQRKGISILQRSNGTYQKVWLK